MLIVNLYGAPGAGKSTGAAYIFSRLNMAGVNVDLVTEFAKDKVWEESKTAFENQVYIFGEQFFRISRLEGKVDVVVTDSPLMLNSYYGKDDIRLGDEFNALVKKISNSYDTLDIFFQRVKPYNPLGRRHTEAESDSISDELLEFLNKNGVKPIMFAGDISGYDSIVGITLDLLKRK